MRIVIFQRDLGEGGIQKSLVNLLNNIDNSLVEVDLYLWERKQFFEIENKQINIIYKKQPNKLVDLIYKMCPFRILKWFYRPSVKEEYDVAVDFSGYANYCALEALGVSARRRVIWVHNDMEQNLKCERKYRVLWWAFRKKFAMFDEVVAVSEGAKKSFLRVMKVDPERVKVVPNYVDAEEIESKGRELVDIKLDKRCVNLVLVGRLTYQKGVDIAIEELGRAVKKNKKLRLYVIGDGAERGKLEKKVRRDGLEDYVVFLGAQKNPYKYMEKMDGMVVTSRFEGQGIAMIEARALGLPVIMSANLREVVTDIKPVKDVAEAMAKMTRKKRVLESLAEYNREVMDGFGEVIRDNKRRVVFVAAGGGHLAELLQLQKIFERYDYTVVTERDETTQKLGKRFRGRVRLLPRYGGSLVKRANEIIQILAGSKRIIKELRPEYVVTTGSGMAGIFCWMAKRRGAKVIFIETAANVSSPSKTGKKVYGFADLFVIQHEELKRIYPRAKYGGLIFGEASSARDGKYGLVLMGTQPQQFARLVGLLETVKLSGKVVIQSGNTDIASKKYEVREFVKQGEFDSLVSGARYVITHGGVGSIMTALAYGKPVLVVPRERRYGEHVNNHQKEIAKKLEKSGYVLVAENEKEFKKGVIQLLTGRLKKPVFNNSKLVNMVSEYIDGEDAKNN